MLEFSDDFKEFKKKYFTACEKNEILTHNKICLLALLANRLSEKPFDNDLRQLLFIALSDNGGVLLSHFYESSQEEINYNYKYLKKRYFKLVKYYENQKQYISLWEQIMAVKKLPEPGTEFMSDETLYKEEAVYLSDLYHDIFEINKTDTPELYYNLRRFLYIVHQIPEYRQIIPLFIFQIMVRHAKRLNRQENLGIVLKKLWSFKEYKISDDNNKNYRQYKIFSKLFRKLCKYYKYENGVNIDFCKYGFRKTSNLYWWIINVQPKKSKKVLDKYYFTLSNSDMSYIEICEPDKNTAYYIFKAQEYEMKYFEEYTDDYLQVQEAVEEYINEHEEKYLAEWVVYIKLDIKPLEKLVDEIYKECIPKLPEEKQWQIPCIKAHIYEIAGHLAEDYVKRHVLEVLDM